MLNSTSGPSQVPTGQNTQRLVLDNLIRRELKVGDPNDPNQIAQALMDRYQADPRAQAMQQEARGLPFLRNTPHIHKVEALSAACGPEWQQAVDHIECDLRSLTTDAILKDVAPEIRGWAQAIRTALTEGYNAARFALDPRNRDKGFAMRRQLNDYARLARLVGVHTPSMVTNFRKFAQSLDEGANLLVVIMGEVLAQVSYGGGRYLPQVAYSDLQTRRDAVIYAMRNLVGSTQMAYGQGDWPWGLDAYRQLYELLESQGQGDLRSLLVETELARTMDELVQRSNDNTADGLRAVGSTSMLALERFRRLLAVARRGINPPAPPLAAFLEALRLFAQSFDSSGGFRLMKIARPPILFYGLYGSNGLDAADQRLISIITNRGLLADALDCMAGDCCVTNKQCMVCLDKILYDIDRAIDLYALGHTNFGHPERRAAAYGYLSKKLFKPAGEADDKTSNYLCGTSSASTDQNNVVASLLNQLTQNLQPQLNIKTDVAIIFDEIANKVQNETALRALTSNTDYNNMKANTFSVVNLINIRNTIVGLEANNKTTPIMPSPALDECVNVIIQELGLQMDMENHWYDLVHTMVANCSEIDKSLGAIQTMVGEAIKEVSGTGYSEPTEIRLPPPLESSFDSFVNRIEQKL